MLFIHATIQVCPIGFSRLRLLLFRVRSLKQFQVFANNAFGFARSAELCFKVLDLGVGFVFCLSMAFSRAADAAGGGGGYGADAPEVAEPGARSSSAMEQPTDKMEKHHPLSVCHACGFSFKYTQKQLLHFCIFGVCILWQLGASKLEALIRCKIIVGVQLRFYRRSLFIMRGLISSDFGMFKFPRVVLGGMREFESKLDLN